VEAKPGASLPLADRTYLHVEFVDFVEKILDAVVTSTAMQEDEFDVSRCQEGRNMLVVHLGD
jgi:hypothetical protein